MCPTPQARSPRWPALLAPGDAVLVKGSNGVGLGLLVASLKGRD